MTADTSPTPPEPAPRKPQRKWLYASVALNLLLAGVLAGNAMVGLDDHRHPKHPPPPMAVRDVGFAFMRALPEERRKEISKKMKSQFGEARPLFEESIAARKEAFSLLEQENVTPEQLKAAFAKVQSVDAQAQTRAADFFARMVAELPAAERRAAVAKMRERWAARENMRMRWKSDDDDRRDPRDGPPMGAGVPRDGPPPRDDLLIPGEGPPPPPRD